MDNGTVESIVAGDVVLCREIKRDLWRSKLHITKWSFVIVHRELGIVIKKISSHNTSDGIITLRSINPEYEDFNVKLDDCLQIFNVIKIMRDSV